MQTSPPLLATPHRDTLLVQSALDGDQGAWTSLTSRLEHRVRRRAAHLMRGAPDADDAAQETWIEILRSMHHYQGRASLERWVDRITTRSVIRYARKRRAEATRIQADAEPERQGAALPQARRTEALPGGAVGGLTRLSPERQDALLLHHGYGYTVDEVAGITGVSRNTIKDRLRESRRLLRGMVAVANA